MDAWCYCIFYVRQDWNMPVAVSLWEKMIENWCACRDAKWRHVRSQSWISLSGMIKVVLDSRSLTFTMSRFLDIYYTKHTTLYWTCCGLQTNRPPPPGTLQEEIKPQEHKINLRQVLMILSLFSCDDLCLELLTFCNSFCRVFILHFVHTNSLGRGQNFVEVVKNSNKEKLFFFLGGVGDEVGASRGSQTFFDLSGIKHCSDFSIITEIVLSINIHQ